MSVPNHLVNAFNLFLRQPTEMINAVIRAEKLEPNLTKPDELTGKTVWTLLELDNFITALEIHAAFTIARQAYIVQNTPAATAMMAAMERALIHWDPADLHNKLWVLTVEIANSNLRIVDNVIPFEKAMRQREKHPS